MKPFEKITYYNKNYHGSGKNRQNDIYYYLIRTNMMSNFENTSLDEWEKDGNLMVKRVPLRDVEKVLRDTILDNPINKVILEEMLDIFKEYNKIKDFI